MLGRVVDRKTASKIPVFDKSGRNDEAHKQGRFALGRHRPKAPQIGQDIPCIAATAQSVLRKAIAPFRAHLLCQQNFVFIGLGAEKPFAVVWMNDRLRETAHMDRADFQTD
jgi:hypothetical protein